MYVVYYSPFQVSCVSSNNSGCNPHIVATMFAWKDSWLAKGRTAFSMCSGVGTAEAARAVLAKTVGSDPVHEHPFEMDMRTVALWVTRQIITFCSLFGPSPQVCRSFWSFQTLELTQGNQPGMPPDIAGQPRVVQRSMWQVGSFATYVW